LSKALGQPVVIENQAAAAASWARRPPRERHPMATR
jgi:hypothetical protein